MKSQDHRQNSARMALENMSKPDPLQHIESRDRQQNKKIRCCSTVSVCSRQNSTIRMSASLGSSHWDHELASTDITLFCIASGFVTDNLILNSSQLKPDILSPNRDDTLSFCTMDIAVFSLHFLYLFFCSDFSSISGYFVYISTISSSYRSVFNMDFITSNVFCMCAVTCFRVFSASSSPFAVRCTG